MFGHHIVRFSHYGPLTGLKALCEHWSKRTYKLICTLTQKSGRLILCGPMAFLCPLLKECLLILLHYLLLPQVFLWWLVARLVVSSQGQVLTSFCKMSDQKGCLVLSSVSQTAILVLERSDGVSLRFILLPFNKALQALWPHMTASNLSLEIRFPVLWGPLLSVSHTLGRFSVFLVLCRRVPLEGILDTVLLVLRSNQGWLDKWLCCVLRVWHPALL